MADESAPISVLQHFNAGDIVLKHKPVITIKESTTVEETLDILKKFNILSAPIVKEDGSFIGIINLWDIATALSFNSLFETYDDEKLDKELLSEALFSEALKINTFKSPISSIVGLSEESKTLWVFDWDVTLDKLVDPFSKGVHRVLIKGVGIDDKEKDKGPEAKYRFLSQTDVVRFLFYSNLKQLRPILDKSLRELGLVAQVATDRVSNKVVSITTKNSALTGFRKLTLHETNAVPIVDEAGALRATLSASDLRGIHQDTFKNTLLPVLDFLTTQYGKLHVPVTCLADESLSAVAERILTQRVHRAWVVDNNRKVMGVVTLSDIICKFSPYDFKATGSLTKIKI